MTKEERREYSRKYYQANREKLLAQQKQYYLERADERKEYQKQYYLEHADEAKEYRLEHADEAKEYQKQYRLEHKDEIREREKQYRLEHKDEIREQKKHYNLEHADECKRYQKQYRLEHADEHRKKMKQYRESKKGRAIYLLNAYCRDDDARGFDTSGNITADWIIANIFSGQKCVYCGETDWKKLGTDRVDNDKPHTPDNVVCCCGECNVKRNKHYSFEEFKDKIAER